MHATSINDYSCIEVESFSLLKMVDQQIKWVQEPASKKNSLFVNDIPSDFWVSTNKDLLSTVIYCLITNLIENASGNCFQVTAKRYGKIILLRFSGNKPGRHGLRINWQKVIPISEKLGGCITVDDLSASRVTISFSFRCEAVCEVQEK